MTLASEFSLDAAQLQATLFALDTQVNEPVQMKLLAWVMGLPNDLDPAVAARLVMREQNHADGRRLSAPLLKLIEVVAQYPRERLAQLVGARRRSALN